MLNDEHAYRLDFRRVIEPLIGFVEDVNCNTEKDQRISASGQDF